MSQRATHLSLLALSHLAAALVFLLLVVDQPANDSIDLVGLALAHVQIMLVALWAAFGRLRFPLRWAALAATTGAWSWMLARPYVEPPPLMILSSEAAALLVALYAARGLGVSLEWEPLASSEPNRPSRRYGIVDLLLAMVSAAVVFSLLRGALWFDRDGLGDSLGPRGAWYLVVFRAAYVAFALIGCWCILGAAPALRRAAWLVTFVVGWIALTVSIYPPAELAPLQFIAQRLGVTALFCGSLIVVQREGLRMRQAWRAADGLH